MTTHVKNHTIGTISEARIVEGSEPEIQPQRLNEEHPSWDDGIVRSVWRHTETGRNDQSLKETSSNSMKIYGCQVIRSRVIAPGTVYICGELKLAA